MRVGVVADVEQRVATLQELGRGVVEQVAVEHVALAQQVFIVVVRARQAQPRAAVEPVFHAELAGEQPLVVGVLLELLDRKCAERQEHEPVEQLVALQRHAVVGGDALEGQVVVEHQVGRGERVDECGRR